MKFSLEDILKSKSIKTVRRIIYRAEVIAPSMGVYAPILIQKYADEIKKDKDANRMLKNIISQYEKGKTKDAIYKRFLDNDILLLLKESLSTKVSPAEIFKGYVPFKEKADKIKKDIKTKLYFPVIMDLIVIFGINYTLSMFKEMSGSNGINFGETLLFLMEHFLAINFAVLLFVGMALVVFPEKTPYLKTVFLKIRALLAMSTVKTMASMNHPAEKIAATIIKQFDIKQKGVLRGKGDGIDKLLKLLREQKFLNEVQSAELKINAEKQKLKEGTTALANELLDEVNTMKEVIDDAISKISLVLIGPPIAIMVFVLITLTMSATSAAQY